MFHKVMTSSEPMTKVGLTFATLGFWLGKVDALTLANGGITPGQAHILDQLRPLAVNYERKAGGEHYKPAYLLGRMEALAWIGGAKNAGRLVSISPT